MMIFVDTARNVVPEMQEFFRIRSFVVEDSVLLS